MNTNQNDNNEMSSRKKGMFVQGIIHVLCIIKDQKGLERFMCFGFSFGGLSRCILLSTFCYEHQLIPIKYVQAEI